MHRARVSLIVVTRPNSIVCKVKSRYHTNHPNPLFVSPAPLQHISRRRDAPSEVKFGRDTTGI
jgi:hypothetical protein